MTVWCCDFENGDDANGGTSWGSPLLTIADAVTVAGSANLTSASGLFTPAMVGHGFTLYTGTTFASFRYIQSYTSPTVVVASSAFTVSSTYTARIGGAMKTMSAINATALPTGRGLAAGDEIRHAKSPDALGIGNATWTNLDKTVTLAAALTQDIADGTVAWTGKAQVTCSTNTSVFKMGTRSASMVIGSLFNTGQVAWKATGASLDLSGYTHLSFWIRSASLSPPAGRFRMDLFTSNDGSGTPTDSFTINVAITAGAWVPLVIARDGGGNLGSGIQSVAIHAISDPGAMTVYLQNIIACKDPALANSINLCSVIGKNSWPTDPWHGIQSISGTTILLDQAPDALANEGMGAYCTSGTYTTYKRETTKIGPASSATVSKGLDLMGSGSPGARIAVSGGYDPATGTRTGLTFYDGLNGYGYGLTFAAVNYWDATNFGLCRFSRGLRCDRSNSGTGLNIYVFCCGSRAGDGIDNVDIQVCSALKFTYLISNNSGDSGLNINNNDTSSAGFSSFNQVYQNCVFCGNWDDGADPTGAHDIFFRSVVFANNRTVGMDLDRACSVYCDNCLFAGNLADEITFNGTRTVTGSFVRSSKHNQQAGRFKTICGITDVGNGGVISDHLTAGLDASWPQGGSGVCLVMNPVSTLSGYELEWSTLIPVVAGGIAHTITFYHRKETGTNPLLFVQVFDSGDPGYQLVSQSLVTLADSWGTYTTITFYPTATGACRVIFKARQGSTPGKIGIDSISCSRAA